MLKSKYVPTAFAVFGIMCGIFAFFTEVRNEVIVIASTFYLQMSIASFLAAIYFDRARNH